MSRSKKPLRFIVTCRIGSLESVSLTADMNPNVTCRIGSLESNEAAIAIGASVTCRIGSLEIRRLKFSQA